MCGISGIFLLQNKKRTKSDYNDIRKLTKKLILNTSARGINATGIAVINKDRLYLLKLPIDAEEFVKKKEFKNILQKIDETSIAVLSHNRFKTQGSVKNPHNNHPIIHGSIIGIHNGIVSNDKEIFKKLKIKRKGQVDSESIFAIINDYKKKRKKLVKAFSEIDGRFALAFLDRNKPFRAIVGGKKYTLEGTNWIWSEDMLEEKKWKDVKLKRCPFSCPLRGEDKKCKGTDECAFMMDYYNGGGE